MKNIVICISLTLVALVSLGCDRSTAPGSSASERAIGTVDLTVDFGGEGETIQVAIPVSDGSTVFTTLKRADQHGD